MNKITVEGGQQFGPNSFKPYQDAFLYLFEIFVEK